MLIESRTESWGRIVYDPQIDEFDAEVDQGLIDREISIDRPISAGCLVTGRCNLGCRYCYGNDEALPTEEISAVEWGHLFSRLRSWGLLRVDLSGGEPTLRRDIGDIARSACSVGLNVVLSTNGLLPDRLVTLPETLRIHISIDSGDPDVHEVSRLKHTTQSRV